MLTTQYWHGNAVALVPSLATGHTPTESALRVGTPRLASMPPLLAVAILTVYIVLGMLYESYSHPITNALPAAGVGALIRLWARHYDLAVNAIIGIGKKNAIMTIAFALAAQCGESNSARRDPRRIPLAHPSDQVAHPSDQDAHPSDQDDDLLGLAACRLHWGEALGRSCASPWTSPSWAGFWSRSG